MGLADGKVILVTGANSGFGKKTAEILAEQGAKVVLMAHGLEELKEVEERIRAKGREVFSIQGDVTVRGNCDRAVYQTFMKYGSIDVLVNNAGAFDKQIAINCCSDEWYRDMIEVNQDSVFYMSRAALAFMEAQGSGSIINVSRSAGKTAGTVSHAVLPERL